jgi:hypothetical protein
VKIAGPKESNQSDDDQVERDDIVQQPRTDQYKDPGDERYQGRKAQCDIHDAAILKSAPDDENMASSSITIQTEGEFGVNLQR